MSAIVLVHGAMQSAATWDLLVPELRRHGHDVLAPVLTGLGPAGGPLTAEVTLDTHIEDVVRALEGNDLRSVVLVGHSYAGMVITGVADRLPERVAQLVYVDAFVPEDGDAAMDYLPIAIRDSFRRMAAHDPGGFRMTPTDAILDVWKVPAGPVREFVRARLCDFTLRCFEQPIRLHAQPRVSRRAYIACVAEGYPARATFRRFADRARADGWPYYELNTGHDCQAEQPEALARILDELCTRNLRQPEALSTR